MKKIFILLLLCGAIFSIVNNVVAEVSEFSGELVVLAAPVTGDPYYAEVADEIFRFHVNFAQQILKYDDHVLILVDEAGYDRYAQALGEECVAVYPMADIWMRDFGLSNAAAPVMFRYTAAAQGGGRKGQEDADVVQDDFFRLIKKAGLKFRELDLLNDGGNIVDDYCGNAVLSRKFLRDNELSEFEARKILRNKLSLKNVAFIDSDEQGGLEHSDGVVSFVAENSLIINSYDTDPEYVRQLKADLKRGLPGVVIKEVATPYDGSTVYDERFGSACGLYTNALVTPKRIYLPQFGIAEDAQVLDEVRKVSRKEVVAVSSGNVCIMGGGVRCMSWQLRGKNARALLNYFE